MRVVLFLLIISLHSHSYKILVYNSKVGYSNVNFYGNIADILVEAGHDVTTLLPEIDPSLSDDTYTSRKIFVKQTAECKHSTEALSSRDFDYFTIDNFDAIGPFFYGTPYSDRFVLQCRGTLEEPGLIDRLRAEKFDVMITENYDMCGIGLSHLIKPKALINGAASVPLAWMFEEFGLPKSWSYNLSPRNSHLDVHSFWSRLKNLYAEAIQYRIFYSSRSLIGKLFNEKYGTDFPSLTEISSHAAYTIINSEPLVDFATPTLNRIVFVGGLGAKEPQKLSKIFDDILNLRSKSVVISFGSIVASHKLKDAVKAVIVETVAKFPHVTFIWKYEEPADDFAKAIHSTMLTVSNLHFFNWIPQNDLLEDRRSTAFITHAGMGSTQEMVISGKPGLFIPCFGDQPRNAAMLERNGLGKIYDKLNFDKKDTFTAAVADLLENQSYYTNARRVAAMIANKPHSARELLIKSVEFAAEFGPSQALRPQSYDMGWVAYHNVDIIVALSAIMLIGKFILHLIIVMCRAGAKL